MPDYRPPEIPDVEKLKQGEVSMYESPFAKVCFGPGAVAHLDEIVAGLGAKRPAVLCTQSRVSDGKAIQARLSVDSILLAEAVMHTPVGASDRAAEHAKQEGVDLLISTGGGSSSGLGKALTKRIGLRHVALPVTYSGSELTPFLGETWDGDKRTVRDDRFRPIAIIYDPELTMSLPSHTSAASGMNAMAHAIGALTTTNDPDIRWAAEKAVRCFVSALPRIVTDTSDAEARTLALYGAWLAGFCIEAPMALHHKLCHVLGGAYDMPHAETHAAILPHSLAFNGVKCSYAVECLTDVFGGDPAAALFDFIEQLGLKVRLKDLGLPESGVMRVAELVCANPYANPRDFTEQDVSALLGRGWRGERPYVGVF